MNKEETVGSTAKLLSQAWVAWQWEDTYLDLDISGLVSGLVISLSIQYEQKPL